MALKVETVEMNLRSERKATVSNSPPLQDFDLIFGMTNRPSPDDLRAQVGL